MKTFIFLKSQHDNEEHVLKFLEIGWEAKVKAGMRQNVTKFWNFLLKNCHFWYLFGHFLDFSTFEVGNYEPESYSNS